ncbi:PglZ domain-containing protein [Flammeovirga sp. EKP202]|uniref:PglZ domain-containing protein n=1 Tax=Flammeovirga sp. EKP202 TaxID=2770592 RepID=UPI00165F6225|nr:PglZ domain-containing protein [Flammeovirga sp. EKP202]MBD0402934.1 PglZ domain-containing protein [Flammeovirga sp. EKP202]
MIDNWFKEDIEYIYKSHNIAVIIDQSREGQFLIDLIKENYTFYLIKDELDDLKAKYEIEKNKKQSKKFLIYTHLPKDKLRFLREYCETNGSLEIKYFENYIKEKVHDHLKLNLNIPKEELISAAKVSLGNDQTYWMDLSHKGTGEIFNLEKELLSFIDDPHEYVQKYDVKVQEVFYKKVNELIGQNYIPKPVETLAKEVVFTLFDGLLEGNPNKTLFEVYKKWLDSKSCQQSLENYLSQYTLKQKSDIYSIHPDHPFLDMDKLWLENLGENLSDKSYQAKALSKIRQRIKSKATRHLQINFWTEVVELITFDRNQIAMLESLEDCIKFYKDKFWKLDHAIRVLYASFLESRKIITPFQQHYKESIDLFFHKWFAFVENYKSTQTGKLKTIIENTSNKLAIVVGDGLSYEFTQDIIQKVNNKYKLNRKFDIMLAGLPSETEHNMSQLYVNTGDVFSTKRERENYLSGQFPDKNMGFVDLESVTELTDKDSVLICSCKDPDKLGETYQQKALKYFDSIASLYAQKIEQLLQNGYSEVHLVTDHGFVLTGLLEESDKIEFSSYGDVQKSERYILSNSQQSIDKNLYIEREINTKGYKYAYFSKRLGPFKTPGVYGYSHGGLTPQETIIPHLKWENTPSSTSSKLNVAIDNKRDLQDVTGDLFGLKIKAESETLDAFSAFRKIILLFFHNGEKYNESDIISIKRGEEISKEFQFSGKSEIEIRVLDASTKEKLDSVTVKQSTARDLGGLF